MWNYNSNGYQGVIAEEDNAVLGLSSRNIIHDDIILPLYDDTGKNKISYSLLPTIPTDTIEECNNIPWDYQKGMLSLKMTGPDGKTVDLGSSRFTGKSGALIATENKTFTNWKPSQYGYYTVLASGWMMDIWGNKYPCGGTYHFWIAKRMTMATATFQGMAYPVGSRYGRDIGFDPAVPANVQVTATLYVNSDSKNTKTVTYSGNASASGIFGAAQGMLPLVLDSPG